MYDYTCIQSNIHFLLFEEPQLPRYFIIFLYSLMRVGSIRMAACVATSEGDSLLPITMFSGPTSSSSVA